MKKRISETEIRKELNVSKKEMKHYKAKGFIKPTLDDDGVMGYTLAEMIKLRYVIMYKDLEFDEKEIAKKINYKSNFEIFEDILRHVKSKAEYNLDISLQTKLRLDKVLERIYKTGNIRIEYIDELDKSIIKKEKKKDSSNLFIHELLCLLIFFMILVTIFSIFSEKYYILFVVAVLGILVLIRYKYYRRRGGM